MSGPDICAKQIGTSVRRKRHRANQRILLLKRLGVKMKEKPIHRSKKEVVGICEAEV
jgi:transposase